MLAELRKDIKEKSNLEKAKLYERYFKTGIGQYGAGDIFLDLTVPQSRAVVKKYKTLPLPGVVSLLHSKYHEERLIALLLLVSRFESATKQSDQKTCKKIYKLYLESTKYINNWDLVDISAHKIVGPFLDGKSKDTLFQLAKSRHLWDRRIAIISTFYYLEKRDPALSLQLAKELLGDKHDLIHKAVGWVLREVGKTCGENLLTNFLDENIKIMPRTSLRYAIEKLNTEKRNYYLKL